ncbi:MAG: methylated-DNA--[protein]-cysteine S-methyltransferase [bacterium]|nr:methylated-DNA--[protein]-cysteine S-methyltransferase [bacterium]
MTLAQTGLASPVGDLTLVASETGLVAVLWEDDDLARVRLAPRIDRVSHPVLVEAGGQLSAYFKGERKVFTVPLDFRGTTFQRVVWAALLDIPYGQTRSYADIARSIGRPTAYRAVGAANGRNPISIIAPCHRVVGSNGALTGFAGGLAAKTWLLDHERRTT